MSGGARIVGSLVVIGVVAAASAAWYVRGPGPMDFSGGSKVALADYKEAKPTGVPAKLAQASLIERGAYLARAADCMVCHTAQGGRDYAGGLPFKLAFGTLYSTNITPDKETGIGNYTDEDFLNAMHRGIRRDGQRLYPAMPFAAYTYMSDDDALAIKAYLFSLDPVRNETPGNTLTFPFNQRWGMAFWSALFNPDTRFAPDTSQSAEWNRGAYLAEALAHCGDCHTPRNLAFALDNRKKFGGALTAGWRAYNISSDKSTGVGGWSKDDLISYLSTGHVTGHGTASGPMGEAVLHSFSKMAPEDIAALVTYLRSVPAVASNDPSTFAPPAPASYKEGGGSANAAGQKIFEGSCVSCHGWSGESGLSPFATLTGSRSVNDPSGTNVVQVILNGTKTTAGALSMPAFGSSHSDEEIAAVANYVTARFGTKGAQLTAQDVAQLRAQTAQ
ncbi:MAG: c-type cytochrome [Bradyrhizobiaceae bacterium]|nr:MAG: c-type cytochrome [Bradyrhizobiaceae bacterium]